MTNVISSFQNPRIKNLLLLQQKSRERRKQQLVVVEGLREIGIAVSNDFKLVQLYVCPEIADPASFASLSDNDNTTFISKAVFETLAYREGSDGCIAVLEPKNLSLIDVKLRATPLLIVLEAVEKPGNLGAILRTADAVQADAVIICDPLTDLYNPNVIRSSIGCIFALQVVTCSSVEAMSWLKEHKFTTYAAELTASRPYHQFDYTCPTAFVLGTEADGLTQQWIDFCDHRVIIPMSGSIDSLNVSVSTAVLAFEALRQRDFSIK
ncbi:MAG: RNA methyltransferase [Lentimicrobiaceae bacterium]|jgi:TrmH family RNA methyltransferase|nr:RNA methyltransferase [Lentimicrobiaceae bacterium]HAH58228.1 rRNA methyltransferase [Bacteroidales bacterium]